MIKQIGHPLRGRPILLITRMITDRIGLLSVLLPLLITGVGSRLIGSCRYLLRKSRGQALCKVLNYRMPYYDAAASRASLQSRRA